MCVCVRAAHLVVDDWHVGSRGEGHSGDAADVLAKLRPDLQSAVSGEGPEHGVDQVPLQGGEGKAQGWALGAVTNQPTGTAKSKLTLKGNLT